MVAKFVDVAGNVGGRVFNLILVGLILSLVIPLIGQGPFTPVVDSLVEVYSILPHLLGGTLTVLAFVFYLTHRGGSWR